MPPQTPNPLPPANQKVAHAWMFVALIGGMLVLLGTITGLAYIVYSQHAPATTASPSVSTAATSTADAIPVGYTRQEDALVGLSFLVPPGWVVRRDYEKSLTRNDLFIESPDVQYKKSSTTWAYNVVAGSRIIIGAPTSVPDSWWTPQTDGIFTMQDNTSENDGSIADYSISAVRKDNDIVNQIQIDYSCAHCDAADAARARIFTNGLRYIHPPVKDTTPRAPSDRALFTHMSVSVGDGVVIRWTLQDEVLGEIFLDYFKQFQIQFDLVDQNGSVVGTLSDERGIAQYAQLYDTSMTWSSMRLRYYAPDGVHFPGVKPNTPYRILATLFPVTVDSYMCDPTYAGTCKPIYSDGDYHARVLEATLYSSLSDPIVFK